MPFKCYPLLLSFFTVRLYFARFLLVPYLSFVLNYIYLLPYVHSVLFCCSQPYIHRNFRGHHLPGKFSVLSLKIWNWLISDGEFRDRLCLSPAWTYTRNSLHVFFNLSLFYCNAFILFTIDRWTIEISALKVFIENIRTHKKKTTVRSISTFKFNFSKYFPSLNSWYIYWQNSRM